MAHQVGGRSEGNPIKGWMKGLQRTALEQQQLGIVSLYHLPQDLHQAVKQNPIAPRDETKIS